MEGMTAPGDSLGQRIRRAYQGVGLNRSQFQRALGVAYSTVLMWERDRTHPNADNLRSISQVTGQSLGDLLGSSSEPGNGHSGRMHQVVVARFFASGAGRGATDDERSTLMSVAYFGMAPTAESLEATLSALRKCRPLPAGSAE